MSNLFSWLSRKFGSQSSTNEVSVAAKKLENIPSSNNTNKPLSLNGTTINASVVTPSRIMQHHNPTNTQNTTLSTYVAPIGSTQEDVIRYLKGSPSGITFVHGKAGCGKTYLIQQVIKQVPGCQVLAPTNLAASLYPGNGRTFHSFFHGSFDDLEEGYQNPANIDNSKSLIPLCHSISTLK